jgi:hypothetical protein
VANLVLHPGRIELVDRIVRNYQRKDPVDQFSAIRPWCKVVRATPAEVCEGATGRQYQ